MKFVVCCVRDSAADVYGVPMFMGSKGQAIRSFSDEVQREAPDNMLSRHPEDFELYEIGSYDDAAAMFESVVPRLMIRGVDCRKV